MFSFSAPRAHLDLAAEQGAPHLRPIATAVRDHGCGQGLVMQHAGAFALPTSRPLIAIIGDDTERALGPVAFHRASLVRLLKACGAVAIVSSDADPAFYASAARVAVVEREHVAIVETRAEQEQAWLDFVHAANPGASIRLCTVVPAGRA